MFCPKCKSRMFPGMDYDRILTPAKIWWCLCCGLDGTAAELPQKASALEKKRLDIQNHRSRHP